MTTFDRIKELLDRAGHPMMFVANEENHTIRPKAYATIAEAIDAYLKEKQRDDNDLIERLTAVLENVLNERDALLEEVNGMCHACKHIVGGMATDGCKMTGEFQCTFEWRGVPDKEG